MKTKLLTALVTAALIMETGCSLIPKRVEYFQDKVHQLPSPSDKHVELRKESADFIARKTDETLVAAVRENASTNVLKPAVEAKVVAGALSTSLGKPESPYVGNATNLNNKLGKEDNKLAGKVEDFREDNDKNAGKKIEGTGLFSMNYFVHSALVLGIGFVLFYACKIGLRILSISNPEITVGTNIVSGGVHKIAQTASKLSSELITGGENFKASVDQVTDDPALQQKILDLFKTSHQIAQSPDTQKLVQTLTQPAVQPATVVQPIATIKPTT